MGCFGGFFISSWVGRLVGLIWVAVFWVFFFLLCVCVFS